MRIKTPLRGYESCTRSTPCPPFDFFSVLESLKPSKRALRKCQKTARISKRARAPKLLSMVWIVITSSRQDKAEGWPTRHPCGYSRFIECGHLSDRNLVDSSLSRQRPFCCPCSSLTHEESQCQTWSSVWQFSLEVSSSSWLVCGRSQTEIPSEPLVRSTFLCRCLISASIHVISFQPFLPMERSGCPMPRFKSLDRVSSTHLTVTWMNTTRHSGYT